MGDCGTSDLLPVNTHPAFSAFKIHGTDLPAFCRVIDSIFEAPLRSSSSRREPVFNQMIPARRSRRSNSGQECKNSWYSVSRYKSPSHVHTPAHVFTRNGQIDYHLRLPGGEILLPLDVPLSFLFFCWYAQGYHPADYGGFRHSVIRLMVSRHFPQHRASNWTTTFQSL
jgi:hypothetical protein